MTAALLLAWWNLLYLLPLLLALVYLLVYAASGLTFGDTDLAADTDTHAEVDADAHAEVDADAHAEVDADAHAEVDADASADADADADHDAHVDTDTDSEVLAAEHAAPAARADGSNLWKALGWLGVGRVPVSIVLMLLFVTWGCVGFAANYAVWSLLGWESAAVLLSLPLAAVVSLTSTRGAVSILGRWMPTTETSAEPRARLVGRSGEALYNIDERFGMVVVRNRQGDLYQVPCRVYAGRKPVEKGQAVLLVDYDPQQEFFYVTEDDLKA